MIEFLGFIVFCFIFIIIWFNIMKLYYKTNAKKCKYNCKECKAFDCAMKFCGKLDKENKNENK